MKKTYLICALLSVLVWGSACRSPYHLQHIERTRILIDKTYDAQPDMAAKAWIQPYQAQVDSMMNPVVGRVGCYLEADRPESPLSNLLTDILIWAGKDYQEKPDFAVYNIGGMRAALAEGDVTIGDVLEVAPFDNKICFVNLTGTKVKELFSQIAMQRGEGVSHGVELEITKDGQLKSARLNGKEIDDAATYRIATIDYVAQGNDKMTAFKSSTDINQPEGEENNVRFVIMDYLREMAKQGITVTAKKEGRIIVKE